MENNEQLSLCSLAKVGQTLATLLNNSIRLMPIVPTFHALLTVMYTVSCPVSWNEGPFWKEHQSSSVPYSLESEPVRTVRDPGNQLIQCSLLTCGEQRPPKGKYRVIYLISSRTGIGRRVSLFPASCILYAFFALIPSLHYGQEKMLEYP